MVRYPWASHHRGLGCYVGLDSYNGPLKHRVVSNLSANLLPAGFETLVGNTAQTYPEVPIHTWGTFSCTQLCNAMQCPPKNLQQPQLLTNLITHLRSIESKSSLFKTCIYLLVGSSFLVSLPKLLP